LKPFKGGASFADFGGFLHSGNFMLNSYVIIAKKTVQVSEDSWERQKMVLNVYPDTTLQQIDQWVIDNRLDPESGYRIVKSENAPLNKRDFPK
jgi:hypothetical protein